MLSAADPEEHDSPAGSGPSLLVVAKAAALLAVVAVVAGASYLLDRSDDAVPEAELDPRIVEIIEDESLASPLNFLLGIEEGQVDFVDMETRAQNTIAECMAEKGFVYIPVVDFPEGPEQLSGSPGAPPPLEQVERLGFGIVSSIEYELSGEAAESKAVPDPNDEIRAALSPGQLAEYERALNGASMPDLDEIREDSADTVGAPIRLPGDEDDHLERVSEGCLFQACGEGLPSESVIDLLFSDAFSDLQEAIQSDPDTVQIEVDWASCMASEGYQYETCQAAISDVYRRADEILAHASLDGLDRSSPHIANELAHLKTQEIEVALADLKCSEGFGERFLAVSRDYEIHFIQANEGLILAILEERGNQ